MLSEQCYDDSFDLGEAEKQNIAPAMNFLQPLPRIRHQYRMDSVKNSILNVSNLIRNDAFVSQKKMKYKKNT